MAMEGSGGGGNGADGVTDYTSNGQANFHAHGEGVSEKYRAPDGRLVEIRNVWADNLEQEMLVIRELVEQYPYVAMDTEFPGIVARPVGDFNQPDYQYQTLRCNVDMLKMIQLGLAFVNQRGELPESGACVWQFNFSFSLNEDMYAHDSIQLLKNSGINFEGHSRRGIDVQFFGELLMTSGLVLVPNVTWISFHSGYDFGYLLKLLTCTPLPPQESEFFELLQLFFPNLYDIKFLVSSQDGFHGGLNKLAEDLKVDRIGPMHQAGSDSLLTAQVFLKVADISFNGVENLDKGKNKGKFSGQLYGYGGNQTGIYRPASKATQQHHNGGLGQNHTANISNTNTSPANANAPAAAGNSLATSTASTAAITATAAVAVATADAVLPDDATSSSSPPNTSGAAGGGNVVNSSAEASALANPTSSGDPNPREDDKTTETPDEREGADGSTDGTGGTEQKGEGASTEPDPPSATG